MNIYKTIEKELILKINKLLNGFEGYEEAFIKNNGDIVIKKRINKKRSNDVSLLTNIFKEIMKNDEKKNRVWNPVSYLIELIEYQGINITKDCSDKLKSLNNYSHKKY